MTKDDRVTSLETLKEQVKKFCEDRGWDPYHSPKDLAIGLVTEASELLEVFRFIPERDLRAMMENDSDRQRMADELADSLYFILRFAQLYGFDLSDCVRKKLAKNEIKYPKPDHQ